MKKKDLIKDVIYQFYWDGFQDIIYIGKVYKDGSDILESYMKIGKEKFFESCVGASINDAIKNCKPATSEQVRWFNACTKANKFIPLNEVKTNTDEYEIY